MRASLDMDLAEHGSMLMYSDGEIAIFRFLFQRKTVDLILPNTEVHKVL